MRKQRSDRVSDEIVLDWIRFFYENRGRFPTHSEIDSSLDKPLSAKCISVHFGTVNKAFELATGIKILKSRRYSKQMVMKDILRVKKSLGRVPTKEEYDKHRKAMSSSQIKGCFGWNTIIQEMGFMPRFEQHTYLARDGHKCFSHMEVLVDNWLYRNNIEHKKDVKYPFDEVFNPNKKKTCDWVLEDGRWIEFFGMMRQDDYSKKANMKENFCRIKNIDLITIFPKDLSNLNIKLR